MIVEIVQVDGPLMSQMGQKGSKLLQLIKAIHCAFLETFTSFPLIGNTGMTLILLD